MTDHKVSLLALVLVGTTFPLPASPGGAPMTCSTALPNAELLRRVLQNHFTYVDTDSLTSSGLAVRPDTVTIVTNDSTCNVVITAHNAYVLTFNSLLVVDDSAVVLQAGTSHLVEVRSSPGVFVYDSTGTSRTRIEALN